jgi:hypothetical protein
VQFKATCAAFINSDIRLTQQEGYSRENIVAGLVYAIAANYLTKVKGQRPVGKKIFLQGGVALNRALGNAFAHFVGRPVVIPPNPELLGALGVALLALDRTKAKSSPPAATDTAAELSRLAAPEMKLVSRFTCRACQLYCSIDRFEVAGRRFPFGGRCSLFENVWKRKARTAPVPDLVEQRTRLIFGGNGGLLANRIVAQVSKPNATRIWAGGFQFSGRFSCGFGGIPSPRPGPPGRATLRVCDRSERLAEGLAPVQGAHRNSAGVPAA